MQFTGRHLPNVIKIINHNFGHSDYVVQAQNIDEINFTRSLVSFAAKIYPGQNRDGEAVQKHPGDAPDNGYIAIVTIVVATLLVLVLTVVSEFIYVVWKVRKF